MTAEETAVVQNLPIAKLRPFHNHPFKVLDDESMQRTLESISQFGVLVPAIARPRQDGTYELIAGHRRLRACSLLDLKTMPVIVRELDDDAATILMVDSNLQRERLLPSERAFAYKMKMDALKHQGLRTDLTSSQIGTKLLTSQIVGKKEGLSRNQIYRYIRLTNLIPGLLQRVDDQKLAFNPAVEISFLAPEEQTAFMDAMDYYESTPSLSQAQRIKKLSQESNYTHDALYSIMGEEKKEPWDRVTLKSDVLRKYFPRSYTPQQMENTIIRLLDAWQKKRHREQER